MAVGAPALITGLGYVAVLKDSSGFGALSLVTKITYSTQDLGLSTGISGTGTVIATVATGDQLASYVFA